MKHQWEETLCLLPIPLPEVTAALLQKFNGIFIYQGMFWTKNELVAMKWSSLRGWPFPLSEKPPCRKGKGVSYQFFQYCCTLFVATSWVSPNCSATSLATKAWSFRNFWRESTSAWIPSVHLPPGLPPECYIVQFPKQPLD